MEDQVKVQVKFTMDVDGTIYRDALYFSEEEWEAVTPEELSGMKQERVDNWVAAVAAQSMMVSEPEPE